jgi:hypothetical protein
MNDYSKNNTTTVHGLMATLFAIMLIESIGRLIYAHSVGVAFGDGRWITLSLSALGLMVSGTFWLSGRRRHQRRILL